MHFDTEMDFLLDQLKKANDGIDDYLFRLISKLYLTGDCVCEERSALEVLVTSTDDHIAYKHFDYNKCLGCNTLQALINYANTADTYHALSIINYYISDCSCGEGKCNSCASIRAIALYKRENL